MKKEFNNYQDFYDWFHYEYFGNTKIIKIEVTFGKIERRWKIMSVPNYVQRYFPGKVTKERVKKRVKALDNSRFGYKTKEYKDLKRYLRKY